MAKNIYERCTRCGRPVPRDSMNDVPRKPSLMTMLHLQSKSERLCKACLDEEMDE